MAGGGVVGELLAPRAGTKLTLAVSGTQLLLDETVSEPVLVPLVAAQFAKQEALVPPPEPLHVQAYWPLAEDTIEATPAAQRFDAGT